MAHLYIQSQEGWLCLPAQSQEHGGVTRRPTITLGELDWVVKGHQQGSGTGICSSVRKTVRVHEGGLRAGRPLVGSVLTHQHSRENTKIVRFDTDHPFCSQMWQVWKGVECHGERNAACNIIQHYQFGDWSVMVWGDIFMEGHTDIRVMASSTLTAVWFKDEILRAIDRPYAGAVCPGFLLVQDNARPHVAGVCKPFLNDEGIDAIDWPPCSPDLNPAEHLLDTMYQCIRCHQAPPQTVQELADVLIQVWRKSPRTSSAVPSKPCPEAVRSAYRLVGAIHTTIVTIWVALKKIHTSCISLWFQCFTLIFRLILSPAISWLIVLVSTDKCYVILISTNYMMYINLNDSFINIWCVIKVSP